MQHSVELAPRLSYILLAGAKSPVGFSSLKLKRRVSATTIKQGAFFVPACSMAASRWETLGSAGFRFGQSANLMQAATRLLAEARAVPSKQFGAVHNEHQHPYQPQRCNDPQPDPFTRPSRSPVPLALILCQKALPAASHRSHLSRSTAHLWPFLSERQRSYQPPFTRLNPISEVTP